MKRLHVLFSLTSLTVLLVTIERFSFTTSIILQPYSFLRLHEVVQMCLIILFTVIIPFYVLKEVTHNFELLKSSKGTWLGLLFIIGIYFYSTGNGVHEIASFFFNTFCDTKTITGTMCGGLYFNDYYFGNILYFIGAALFTIPILLFERMRPQFEMTRRDKQLITLNALMYALAIFAYAAFDRVLVGLVYSVIMMAIIDVIYFMSRKKNMLPYSFYSMIVYTVGTIASVMFRLIQQ